MKKYSDQDLERLMREQYTDAALGPQQYTNGKAEVILRLISQIKSSQSQLEKLKAAAEKVTEVDWARDIELLAKATQIGYTRRHVEIKSYHYQVDALR